MKISCKLKSHQASSPQSTSLQNAQHPHYTPIQSDQFLIITTRHRLKPIQLFPKQLPIHSPLPRNRNLLNFPDPNPQTQTPRHEGRSHKNAERIARGWSKGQPMKSDRNERDLRAANLLGGLREEDAAGALLGLQQLLHQHPVQRRDQTLRHLRRCFLLGEQVEAVGVAGSCCFSGGFYCCRGPQGLGFIWITATARV